MTATSVASGRGESLPALSVAEVLDMDHEGVKPQAVISEIIEDLAQAEGRMRSARDKMNFPFVADAPDYASIVAHIDSALASAGAAIAEAHGKLHEP